MKAIQREQFPIFETAHFINSCSKGALAIPVRDAYLQYVTDWATDGSPWDLWVTQLEELRGQVAALVGAASGEIAIKTSVSDAVSALASAIIFSEERNTVIVDDYAFPTTAQVWHAQARRGARVVHIQETDDHRLPVARYAEVIDEQTAVVSLTQVCYRHGGRQDEIKAIVELAHEHGALVLLDSYQAVGTLPVDVSELGVDFLVGGMLKYLLGSAGLAFLYVREGLIAELQPTVTGWFGQSNIFAMDVEQHSPSATARRFESGTPPNAAIYAGMAGLEMIAEIGINPIAAQVNALTDAIKRRAIEAGYRIATPPAHGPMIALAAHDVAYVVQRLADAGVIVSSRDGNIRISPHFYNDAADLDALFIGLAAHEQLLVRQ